MNALKFVKVDPFGLYVIMQHAPSFILQGEIDDLPAILGQVPEHLELTAQALGVRRSRFPTLQRGLESRKCLIRRRPSHCDGVWISFRGLRQQSGQQLILR